MRGERKMGGTHCQKFSFQSWRENEWKTGDGREISFLPSVSFVSDTGVEEEEVEGEGEREMKGWVEEVEGRRGRLVAVVGEAKGEEVEGRVGGGVEVEEGRGGEKVEEEFGEGAADDDLAEGEGGEDVVEGVVWEAVDR